MPSDIIIPLEDYNTRRSPKILCLPSGCFAFPLALRLIPISYL